MIKLSYSKLSTLEACSFKYFVNYVLKIRGPGNWGSTRGSISHLVFNVLLQEKRKNYVKTILAAKNIEAVPSIFRYVKKHIDKTGLSEYDDKGNHNYNLINDMIVFGLSLDFYCEQEKGGTIQKGEEEFLYVSPKGYTINGFIDKLVEYEDKIKIFDYKSNATPYEGEEGTTQAMVYSLWAYRVKKMMSTVRFIFLRHEQAPYLDKEFSAEEIEGFEEYLINVTKYLEKFTFKEALSNMAADKGYPKSGFSGKLHCGYAKYPGHIKEKTGQPYFSCFCKFPFKYYGVYDKDGQYLYGSIEKPVLKPGECMLNQEYLGCYAYNQGNYPLGQK